MSNYQEKYLKYKNKYLKLRNNIKVGGTPYNMDNFQHYFKLLEDILRDVSPCHGIDHAKQVMNHAKRALRAKNYEINEEQTEAVLLAALLHDADDSKFFAHHEHNENARLVLHDRSPEFIELVIKMINLVSSSTNGDRIPEEVINKEWMLIPRYADSSQNNRQI